MFGLDVASICGQSGNEVWLVSRMWLRERLRRYLAVFG